MASVTSRPNGASNGLTKSNGKSPSSPELSSNDSVGYPLIKVLTIGASGALFGYATKITQVYLPQVIRNQMVFHDYTMLKVFLAATLGGAVWFIIMSQFSTGLFKSIRDNFASCVNTKRMSAFIAGGTILGMGMTLAGSCPGMVFAQVGSGNKGAVYTLLGCFSGALAYGLLEPTLASWLTKPRSQWAQPVWVDRSLGLSYTGFALPFSLALVGGLLLTERLIPHTDEALDWGSRTHPVLGGLMMGSLQLLVGLAVSDSLGGSSSYCTLLSYIGASSLIPYFKNYRSGLGNWWQVLFWCGTVSTAAVTSYLTDTWDIGVPISPPLGLLGGFLMVFGARMASGCTSGHGLSGMALLSVSSFAAVAAMFAGGIGLQALLRLPV